MYIVYGMNKRLLGTRVGCAGVKELHRYYVLVTSHGFRLPGINLRDGLTTILVKVLVILSLNSIPWFSKYIPNFKRYSLQIYGKNIEKHLYSSCRSIPTRYGT